MLRNNKNWRRRRRRRNNSGRNSWHYGRRQHCGIPERHRCTTECRRRTQRLIPNVSSAAAVIFKNRAKHPHETVAENHKASAGSSQQGSDPALHYRFHVNPHILINSKERKKRVVMLCLGLFNQSLINGSGGGGGGGGGDESDGPCCFYYWQWAFIAACLLLLFHFLLYYHFVTLLLLLLLHRCHLFDFFVVLFDHCLFSSPSLIGCFGILWDSSSSSHAMDWIYFFYDCLLTLPIFPAKLTSTSNPPASSAPPNEEECHRNLLVIRWYQNTETSRLDEFKYEGPPEELLCGITAASVDIHFNSRLSFFWVRWR